MDLDHFFLQSKKYTYATYEFTEIHNPTLAGVLKNLPIQNIASVQIIHHIPSRHAQIFLKSSTPTDHACALVR